MGRQPGFFDVDGRLRELSAKGDDLERISTLVDFEMFRRELERAVPRSDRSKGGRPALDQLLMFKVLLLQAMHTLSDERCEYLIRDRANTIWNFREALKRAGAVEALFQRFDTAPAEPRPHNPSCRHRPRQGHHRSLSSADRYDATIELRRAHNAAPLPRRQKVVVGGVPRLMVHPSWSLLSATDETTTEQRHPPLLAQTADLRRMALPETPRMIARHRPTARNPPQNAIEAGWKRWSEISSLIRSNVTSTGMSNLTCCGATPVSQVSSRNPSSRRTRATV